ncbi:hypothetical protein SAMN02745244_01499 [Tessaracoccus bendigoensis DSM 12906]|uniref:Uncharacterized protein n=1 Tax=Tessaracoccus bendigoensis DSM 12906 TaxID=1123357 RepID=A0A1M6FPG0_9ACTN|nr:hypothetical protein [Tessaracoccus bendigoensis]SHI99556.1 hypothetical protein SAMN02745244_01499 [Tessaracoccus bendigoensis DSM 12906]
MSSAAAPDEPYDLVVEPDGTSWTARENLTEILRRELLGPLYGDDEVLPVDPSTAYPLGRIAPRRLEHGRADDEGEVPDDEDASAEETPDGEDLGPDVEDGDEDVAPRRGLMIPASMGLRFQIPLGLESFTVRASWGKYNPRATEKEDDSGPQRPEYVRTPMDVAVRVRVADLTEGTTLDYPLLDSALLRIDVYSDTDRHLVELALGNDAEYTSRIPVHAWLFQAQVHVEADDQAVFLPVQDPLQDTDLDHGDDELARLSLQYRDRLEFAIGRTCSVSWHEVAGTRRADRLWTTWLPLSETPQTQAARNDAVLTDMSRLAEASADELRAGLEPIVDGYRVWLDSQDEQAKALPDHLREMAVEAVAEARQWPNGSPTASSSCWATRRRCAASGS